MGRFILKLPAGGPDYIEWSTVVDAPVTFGVSREEFIAYYERRHAREGCPGPGITLAERLERVDANGTSCLDGSDVEDVIAGNRAGPDETEATLEQIVQWYCKEQRNPSDPLSPRSYLRD